MTVDEIKTHTESRLFATNETVLRALGIDDQHLTHVQLDLTPGEPPLLTLTRAVMITSPVDHIGGVDLEAMSKDALERIRFHVDIAALRHLRGMRRSWARFEEKS